MEQEFKKQDIMKCQKCECKIWKDIIGNGYWIKATCNNCGNKQGVPFCSD